MTRFLVSFWVVLGMLACSSVASAQWVQGQDKVYGKVWASVLAGSKGFDVDGEVVDVEPFSIVSTRIYLEYGLAENFTLVGIAEPFAIASVEDGDSSNSRAYVGPVIGGVRAAIRKGKIPVAIEFRGGGTGDRGDVNLAPADAGYVFVPTRRGMVAEFDLQVGASFWQMWAQLRWGLGTNSSEDVSGYSMGQFQLGWSHPGSGIVVDIRSHMRLPLEDVEVMDVAGGGQTAYIGLGLGASWWFTKHMAVTVGFDGVVMAKSNAGAAPFTIGFEARN